MKTTIFLSGGGGFIGRNIVEQLAGKYNIVSPNRDELDLCDSGAVSRFFGDHKIDTVIHAANIGGVRGQVETQNTTYINLLMFYNLIRQKRDFKRMIVLGSGAEYDKSHSLVKVSEDEFDMAVPRDNYGFEKYVMSKYAEQVDYITHLRLFGVYGKYENWRVRFISNALCRALAGLPVTINQDLYFEYLYVNDLVKVIDHFISHSKPKHRFYNVGGGRPVNLKSLAEIILRLMDKPLPIQIAKKGLGPEYSCSIGRLKEELGNFEFTRPEVAIKELIGYYQTILPEINVALP